MTSAEDRAPAGWLGSFVMSEPEHRIAELSALGLEHERAQRYEDALAAFRASTASE